MQSRSRATAGMDRIKVLIVDDSAVVRRALTEIIGSAPDLEVIGAVSDPYKAAESMRTALPDVMFLDIEMPRMDGLTFLRKIMAQRPMPVVICSTLTEEGSAAFLKALEAGAVEAIAKPKVATAEALAEARLRICDVARAAAHARIGTRRRIAQPVNAEQKLTADAILPAVHTRTVVQTEPIVAIGASTGGTEAIAKVLAPLPRQCPGMVIVQHMPEGFTSAFARRLDGICAITVREAKHGDQVAPGTALIAPGNLHLIIERVGRRYRVIVRDGPHVARHRPSVDVLFRSAAQSSGGNALGVILTGMGDDGARGMHEMRTAGAKTVAQDEASCVVFGMPKEAIARGGAMKVLGLAEITREIAQWGHVGGERAIQ